MSEEERLFSKKVKLERQSSSRRKLHVQRVNKRLHSVLYSRKLVLQVNQAVNPTSEQVSSSLAKSDISKSQAARQRKKMHQMEHLDSSILFYNAGTEICDLRGIFLQIVFFHSSTKKKVSFTSGSSDFFFSQSRIELKHMHKSQWWAEVHCCSLLFALNADRKQYESLHTQVCTEMSNYSIIKDL